MLRCTRKGCGKEYENDSDGPCIFHEGAPVFHEGLKSWSCCQDVYKPVLDFDEFMAIPGCTRAEAHTAVTTKSEPPKQTASIPSIAMSKDVSGKEVYGTPKLSIAPSKPTPTPPPPVVEEEEDLSVSVKPGTICRHKGCGKPFVSDQVSRQGDGDEAVCVYHPLPPIFHEGSKGYMCCKPKVLEFDEFLKIPGCTKGRHLFSPKVTEPEKEQMATCRIDHYQTVDKVHVSVFAKQVDKERSVINIEDSKITIDLYLPNSKRFLRTLDLFGTVDPSASSFKYFGTKVELLLQKADGKSWTLLEKTSQDLGGVALTFGVGGRTGTVGAKEIVR